MVGIAWLGSFSCSSGPKIAPDTAAMVNHSEIKSSEVEKVFQNRVKQASQTPVAEEAATLKLNILNQLIMDEILMGHASKENLTASEAEVNAKFTDFKKNYSEEKFQQFLKDQGMTVGDIRRELLKNATI